MAVGFLLFTEIEAQIIEGKRYPCSDWQGVTGTSLYSMAQSPNWIGDPSTNQWCRISDATACTTCACDYYVKYTSDGGANWLGLSFSGTAGVGGTGCPGAPGYTSSTQAQATTWLENEHIAAGLCGCIKDVDCKQVNCEGGKCSKTPIADMEAVGECAKGSGCKCYKKKADDECKYDCEVKKGGKCLERWTSAAGEYVGQCKMGKWPNMCYCGYCFKRCSLDSTCKAVGGKCQVKKPRPGKWTQTTHFCDKQRQCKCWVQCQTKACLENIESQLAGNGLELVAQLATKG